MEEEDELEVEIICDEHNVPLIQVDCGHCDATGEPSDGDGYTACYVEMKCPNCDGHGWVWRCDECDVQYR